MLPPPLVLAASFAYLLLLFAVAYLADTRARAGRSVIDNAWVYALSMGVYCTAWTYFGSVGRAASSGLVVPADLPRPDARLGHACRRDRRPRTAPAGRRTMRPGPAGSRAWRQSRSSPASLIHAAAADQRRPAAEQRRRHQRQPDHLHAAVPQRQQRKIQQQPAGREQGEQSLRAKALASARPSAQRVEPELADAAAPRKRFSIASASRSCSRSSVPRSDGRTRLSGLAGGALAQLVRELQLHQEVQRVEQVARELGVEQPARDQAAQPRRRCRARARRAAGQRAHAVHDREGAELLQVQRLSSRRGRQPRPQAPRSPNWSTAPRSGRGTRRCRRGCGPDARAALAARLASPATARGIEKHRQVHRPCGSRAVDPVAQRLAEGGSGWRHSGLVSMMPPGHGG